MILLVESQLVASTNIVNGSKLIFKRRKVMDKCPICGYPLNHCQCLYDGNAHTDRNKEREVVLDHLYLLSEAQLRHIIKLEEYWHISYANMERTAILERLEREHLLEKEECYDWIEKLLEKYD